MAKAYSMDLRVRVVAAVDAGEAPVAVARRFDVSRSWVFKLLRRRRQSGSFTAQLGRRGRVPKLADRRDMLLALVAQRPDATLEELREQLDVRVSISTLWSALQRLGLAFKKSPSRRRAAAA